MIFTDEYFMNKALEQAQMAFEKNEVPVGVVIVHGNQIIARAYNLTETLNDVTAHAEMQAITAAENYLGGKYLNDCTMYVTLEPCIMCVGAIIHARVERVVFGATDPKTGAPVSLYTIGSDDRLNHNFTIFGGILADKCSDLLKDFFRKKRKMRSV